MQLALELLAPARDLTVGTAAIDCGADAVYIAGPSFGARVAAANPVSDIEILCRHAHLYGARVYATLNTLLEEEEMAEAEKLVWEYYEAGVDAVIVQDMRLLSLNLPPIELHASTQCVIRTPERAVELERCGFKRIILERQLSLDRIREIRQATSCEIEFFVHGALCVCYSGQCYLSEQITGRSANRGCCAQPCRSKYDLLDGEGNVLLKDKPVLSLKDYRLDNRIKELVECGVSSFKIEGRLKNASYVKNVVRHYRNVIDRFIEANPLYRKASFGTVEGGFVPNPDATFNRGYTSCWIDGERGRWNSGEAAKALGEYVGRVISAKGGKIRTDMAEGVEIANGDGLSFVSNGDQVEGMRVEVADGNILSVKDSSGLEKGTELFRSLNIRFEHELEKNMPQRVIPAEVSCVSRNGRTTIEARAATGAEARISFTEDAPPAQKPELATATLLSQLGKRAGEYSFTVTKVDCDTVYFHTVSQINAWRRELADILKKESIRKPEGSKWAVDKAHIPGNVPPLEGELMRTKYCVRWELGLCPKQGKCGRAADLYLLNNNRKLVLHFDCKKCEMTVTL
ncbi:MAG: U32 family peptidase [Bacteroidales bacterium]|nr:U32 family peptidase [Candidatus Cacconaster merdequi]